MDPLSLLLMLVALAATVWVVTRPLREDHQGGEDAARTAALADLEAAKAAKYREIRDAELDFRTGKLSEADWKIIDRELRAEAVTLLHRLDELTGDRQAGRLPS